MTSSLHHPQLIDFLVNQHGLDPSSADRIVEEVQHYFNQTPEEFIQSRHRELQNAGQSNSAIFLQIRMELTQRLFAAESYSERKIRRTIYG